MSNFGADNRNSIVLTIVGTITISGGFGGASIPDRLLTETGDYITQENDGFILV